MSFRLPLLALFLFAATAHADSLGLKLPAGFEVTEFAGNELANDIFSMALDPKGRVVVSGRGYIRILVDDNGDGKADRAIPFADGPKDGAQGLLWEGNWLYFTGDGGLRRYPVDASGDKAAGPSELIAKMHTGGEHHAHAIRRGPDGWLYLLVGNTTGIDRSFARSPTSPIKDPVAGCMLRFSPDLKQSEIVADGFRNAYDFDFNTDGELFTYDSDNERCVALPWYEFTRFYHVIPGGHHGWLPPQRGTFWRQPPYFPDVVAPVTTFGRGSPTGCLCYRHVQFPEKYRGGFFLADWTFGRIYFVTLKPSGSTYTVEKEVFLQATGENGFAPTALAVQPATGDLFVSIGGRGTRGAVYRIRYPQRAPLDPAALAKLRWPSRSLDWRPELRDTLSKAARSPDAGERLRALGGLLRHQQQLDADTFRHAIRANWDDPDRYLRLATVRLLTALSEAELEKWEGEAKTSSQRIVCALALAGSANPSPFGRVARLLSDNDQSVRLAGIRLLQCMIGDIGARSAKGMVWEGYTPNLPLDVIAQGTFQVMAETGLATSQGDTFREHARTLAMLESESPQALAIVARQLSERSAALDDMHYLMVISRLRAPRSEDITRQVAETLLNLDRKIVAEKLTRDTFWPLRIAELHAELARKDPKLNETLLRHVDFGRPDHALYCKAPGIPRQQAAGRFLARIKEPGFAWNAELVDLIGELPAEQALPPLRRLWGEAGLEESILPVLARVADPADRDKFLFGLRSPRSETLRASLDALEKTSPKADDDLLLSLVRVIRRLSDSKEEKLLRERIGKLLGKLTGQEKHGSDPKAWSDWLMQAHPELAAKLGGADGVDLNAWKKRLAGIDWSKGDAANGQTIFTKASCAACHSGAQALGPDLRGVSGRFSRDDLLLAILQPSRDIPSRYRTISVETSDGKVYQGLVIYEATDSLILQTGPATTVRLDGAQVVTRGYSDISLMPAGLLDKVADTDIADLLAYLRGLQ